MLKIIFVFKACCSLESLVQAFPRINLLRVFLPLTLQSDRCCKLGNLHLPCSNLLLTDHNGGRSITLVTIQDDELGNRTGLKCVSTNYEKTVMLFLLYEVRREHDFNTELF